MTKKRKSRRALSASGNTGSTGKKGTERRSFCEISTSTSSDKKELVLHKEAKSPIVQVLSPSSSASSSLSAPSSILSSTSSESSSLVACKKKKKKKKKKKISEIGAKLFDSVVAYFQPGTKSTGATSSSSFSDQNGTNFLNASRKGPENLGVSGSTKATSSNSTETPIPSLQEHHEPVEPIETQELTQNLLNTKITQFFEELLFPVVLIQLIMGYHLLDETEEQIWDVIIGLDIFDNSQSEISLVYNISEYAYDYLPCEWGYDIFEEKYHQDLTRLSLLSSSWLKRQHAFLGLFKYAYDLRPTKPQEAENINENLKNYLFDFVAAEKYLKYYLYSPEDQRASHLWGEVNLGYIAAERWMQNVDINRVPRDLEKSLLRKRARLQSFLEIAETVVNTNDILVTINRLV